MSHPTKKQRLKDGHAASADSSDHMVTLDDLSVDLLADIFGFLDGPKDIMCKRQVCRKWEEAVRKTIVPLSEFCVNSLAKFDAMRVMTEALLNLQRIKLGPLGEGHKYGAGQDPDEAQAAETETAHYTTHDIEIISNFSKLRVLTIDARDYYIQSSELGFETPFRPNGSVLNGRYPFLFNSFPLLQKLSIFECENLKWDLEMLAGLPMLKELDCVSTEWLSGINKCMTGNISSLRVLKDTLEKVSIIGCENVEGNLMDLADFPQLKELDLGGTAVTGDIRDIGERDFSSLEHLNLPDSVYGGNGYLFQRISDAPDVARAVYLLKKQRPALKMKQYWCGALSPDSPDWYESVDDDYYGDETPPFYISYVEAGSRLGYRWTTRQGTLCEINWLDPEPDEESSDYAKYIIYLQMLNAPLQWSRYRGFHQPPTEEEYDRISEEYHAEMHEESDE
jgi:hypothetical protein